MSHLHKNRYKDNKELIPYINGFLWTLEILNDDTNHGQTYYVEEIERLETYELSIIKHLFDSNYQATLRPLTDWRFELDQTAKSFFESVLSKVELTKEKSDYVKKYTPTASKSDVTNFRLATEKYLELMHELIGDNSKTYEVFINWDKGGFYECYHKDYLIDNERGLFFLHFGTSD